MRKKNLELHKKHILWLLGPALIVLALIVGASAGDGSLKVKRRVSEPQTSQKKPMDNQVAAVRVILTPVPKPTEVVTPKYNGTRTGEIVKYRELCSDQEINIYENEQVTDIGPDGEVYLATIEDWKCFHNKYGYFAPKITPTQDSYKYNYITPETKPNSESYAQTSDYKEDEVKTPIMVGSGHYYSNSLGTTFYGNDGTIGNAYTNSLGTTYSDNSGYSSYTYTDTIGSHTTDNLGNTINSYTNSLGTNYYGSNGYSAHSYTNSLGTTYYDSLGNTTNCYSNTLGTTCY